jgi:hypothetical protein
MKHPMNYKTQDGLIKALDKASSKPMTVSLAWWFENAKFALVNRWGWTEPDAAIFVVRYKPKGSPYRATA